MLLLAVVSMVYATRRSSSRTSTNKSPATRKAARKPRQGSFTRSVACMFSILRACKNYVIFKRTSSTNRSRNSRRRAAAKARKGPGARRAALSAAAFFKSFSTWTRGVSATIWTRFTDAVAFGALSSSHSSHGPGASRTTSGPSSNAQHGLVRTSSSHWRSSPLSRPSHTAPPRS